MKKYLIITMLCFINQAFANLDFSASLSSPYDLSKNHFKMPKMANEVSYESSSGGFSTNFSIPLYNLNPDLRKSLTFSYNSYEQVNRGFGIGFRLNLPYIQSSRLNLRSDYTIIRNGAAVELKREGDELFEININFFGKYTIAGQQLTALFPDGTTEIFDLKTGNIIFEISKFTSARIEYVWIDNLLTNVKSYNGTTLNLIYSACTTESPYYKRLLRESVVDGFFQKNDKCLNQVNYNKGKSIHFKYSDAFLSKVTWTGVEDKPIFNAEYAKDYASEKNDKNYKILGIPNEDSFTLNLGEEGIRFVGKSDFYAKLGMIPGTTSANLEAQGRYGSIQTGDFNGDGITDLVVSSYIKTPGKKDTGTFDGWGHWEGVAPSWQAPRLDVYLGSLNSDKSNLDFRISNEFNLPTGMNNLIPVCAKKSKMESKSDFNDYFPTASTCNVEWKNYGDAIEGSFNTYLKEHSKIILVDINGDRLLDILSCGQNKYIAINKFNSFEVKSHNYDCDAQSVGIDLNSDGLVDLVTPNGVLLNNKDSFLPVAYPEADAFVKFLEKNSSAANANTYSALKKLTDDKVIDELNDSVLIDGDLDGIPEISSKKDGAYVVATYGRDMTPLKFKAGSGVYEVISNKNLIRLTKLSSWSGYQNNISYKRNGYNIVVDQVSIKAGTKSYVEKMRYSRPMISNLTFENLGYTFVLKERSGIEGMQNSEKYYVYKTNVSSDNPLVKVPFYGMPMFEMDCAAGACPNLKQYFLNPPDFMVDLKEADHVVTSTYEDYLSQDLGNSFKSYQYYIYDSKKTKYLKKNNGQHLGFRVSYALSRFSLKGPMTLVSTSREGVKFDGPMNENFPARAIEEINEMQVCDNAITSKRIARNYYSAANIQDKEIVFQCSGSYDDSTFQVTTSEVLDRNDKTFLTNKTNYDEFGHIVSQNSSTGESSTSNYNISESILFEKNKYGVSNETTFSEFGDIVNILRKDRNNQLVRNVSISHIIPGLTSNIFSDGKSIVLEYELNSNGFNINETISRNGEILDRNSTSYMANGSKIKAINFKDNAQSLTYKADLNEIGDVLRLYSPIDGVDSNIVIKELSYDYLGRVLKDFNPTTGRKKIFSYSNGLKVKKENDNVEVTDLAPSSVPLSILDNEDEYIISSTTDNLLKAIQYYDESKINFKRDGISNISEVLFNFGSDGEKFAKKIYESKTTSKNKKELGFFDLERNEFGMLGILKTEHSGIYGYLYDDNLRYAGTKNDKQEYSTQYVYDGFDNISSEVYKVRDQSLVTNYKRNGLEQTESIEFNNSNEKIKFNYKRHRIENISPFVDLVEYDVWGNLSKISYANGPLVQYSYNVAGQLISLEVQGYKETYVYNSDEKIVSMSSNFNKGKELEVRSYQYDKERLTNPDENFQLPQRNSTLNLDLGSSGNNYYFTEVWGETPVQEDIDDDDIIYEGFGQIRGTTNGNRLTLFLSSDLQYVDGKWVKYFSINGKVIGALVQDEQSSVFYPIVTDVRNSLRMIFSKNQPVVIKNYNDWGNLNTEKSRLSKLSEIIKLDFSSLFRNSNNSKFLISQSRIYSPTHHQWTTYDSLMLRNPEKITFSNIRETDGISYAAGDPVNYTDPTGHISVFAGTGGGAGAGTGARTSGGMWFNWDTSKNYNPFSSGYYTSAGVGGHYGMSAGVGVEFGTLSGTRNDLAGISTTHGFGGGMLGKFSADYSFTSTKAHGFSLSFEFGGGAAGYQRVGNTWLFDAKSDSFLGRATRFANDFYNDHFGSSKSWSDSNSDRYSMGNFNLETSVKMD